MSNSFVDSGDVGNGPDLPIPHKIELSALTPIAETSSEETLYESETVITKKPDEGHQLPQTSPCQKRPVTSRKKTIQLTKHYAAIYIALFYSALLVSTWTIVCILCYRPITAASYRELSSAWSHYELSPREANFRWYRAAEVMGAVADMLVIPVASAVCVKAAVTYSQQPKHQISARKALVLADRGWTSISLLRNALSNNWRTKNASSFLFLALALHILGFSIGPLKQALVTRTTVKTPHWFPEFKNYNDLHSIFHASFAEQSEQIVVDLRYKLMSTASSDVQENLWVRSLDKDCAGDCGRNAYQAPFPLALITYSLNEPFYSQVPAFQNTGLRLQYAPMVRTSTNYELLQGENEFPVECGHSLDNFYKHYSTGNQSLEVCMPGNLTISPWPMTNDRQDITESLYFNLLLPNGSRRISRLDADTVVGYFRLPNYEHEDAGPILEKAPERVLNYEMEGTQLQDPWGDGTKKNPNTPYFPGMALERVTNKGPLLTLALALFGEGSPYQRAFQEKNTKSISCRESGILLLANRAQSPTIDSHASWGLSCRDLLNTAQLQHLLHGEQRKRGEALTWALFLANQGWFMGSVWTGRFGVYFNPGYDTIIPYVSFPAMVGLSILQGIFLIWLLAMAVYASSKPQWTDSLDAFTILRIGAAAGEKVGDFDLYHTESGKAALEDVPCWVGDAEPDSGQGKLEIGADTPLKLKRRYTLNEEYEQQKRFTPPVRTGHNTTWPLGL